jgi:hypothetical protein
MDMINISGRHVGIEDSAPHSWAVRQSNALDDVMNKKYNVIYQHKGMIGRFNTTCDGNVLFGASILASLQDLHAIVH